MSTRLLHLLFLLFSLGANAKEVTIRTCVGRGVTDFSAYLDSIKVPNAGKNLLDRIAQNLKIKILIEDSEVHRCLQLAKNGTVDAVFPIPSSVAVPPLFELPPDAAKTFSVYWNVYSLKSSIPDSNIQSIKDVKGTVGLTFDYLIGQEIAAQGIKVEQSTKTPEALLRQLLTGRVNVILMNSYDFAKARSSFTSQEATKIKMNFTYRMDSMHFALTKKFSESHPGFSAKFYNNIIAEKKKNPYMRELQILEKALQ